MSVGGPISTAKTEKPEKGIRLSLGKLSRSTTIEGDADAFYTRLKRLGASLQAVAPPLTAVSDLEQPAAILQPNPHRRTVG